MTALSKVALDRAVIWTFISSTPTRSSVAVRSRVTGVLCQPAAFAPGVAVGTRVGAVVSSGAGKGQGAAAPIPVNSTSTTLCPGSVVTSRVTVRVSPAASNQ
jgi:hypothetical protein